MILTKRAGTGDLTRAAVLAREALREAQALKMAPLEGLCANLIELLEPLLPMPTGP